VNVTCFTDAQVQAHLDRVLTLYVPADVCAVIAAKQEGPTIAGVIDRTRRFAGEVIAVVGRSTDRTAELAAESGASVLLLEITFPVILLQRRRVNAVYAAAAVAFHGGTWLALGLDYWAWAAVVAVVAVDWSPFVERRLIRRSARYRLWRVPRDRVAAGNQRPPADVEKHEEHSA